MIDRVAAGLGAARRGAGRLQVVRPGLIDGSFGFGGEESRGRVVPAHGRHGLDHRQGRHHPRLLASEILAATGKTPSQHYADLTEHGDPAYARIDAPATREQKAKLWRALPEDVAGDALAGEAITAKLTSRPGNGAPSAGSR